ncbi:hypothetical protein Tco_0320135 [Tanacetum coccineum]
MMQSDRSCVPRELFVNPPLVPVWLIIRHGTIAPAPPRELHQLDTFYNALNANDQDSLNSAAGGNFLDKMPRECLNIIESKSKVRNSRNKAVVAKVSSNSSTPEISPDVAALTTEVSELKNLMKTMLIVNKKSHAPATCQPINQDFYKSNPSGFDQFQPPQFPVNYLPQETSKEILRAQEDLMKAIQAFFKEYDRIPPNEKCMALLLVEERFLKIKQAMEKEQNQPGVMQELLLKLMNDLKIIKGSQQEKKEMAA